MSEWAKNERFAQKTDERIPNPEYNIRFYYGSVQYMAEVGIT